MTRQWVDDAKPRPVDKRWVMRCDVIRDGAQCQTRSEPTVEQPPLERFTSDGWHIAKLFGDVCPACLDAGHTPTSEPRAPRITQSEESEEKN